MAFLGRPNAGKSTLVNRLCGRKVSIVSDKSQTTRRPVQGVLNRAGCQIVLVDTPGVNKPRNELGRHLNSTAEEAAEGVDVACLVLDASAPLGRGDRFLAERLQGRFAVVVSKIDKVSRRAVLGQLEAAGDLGADAYFPVSAFTGDGLDLLVDYVDRLMPAGPPYYPEGAPDGLPREVETAELVREQLLAVMRDELPYSILTRVTDWRWPYIRCEIIVERESQRGIVVGKRGETLKKVGTAVRLQMPEGAYLDLRVRVERDWQNSPEALKRLFG